MMSSVSVLTSKDYFFLSFTDLYILEHVSNLLFEMFFHVYTNVHSATLKQNCYMSYI